MIDEETLQYPVDIAKVIGLSRNEINAMKGKGCPFYGRKTSVKLVRAFIYQTTGAVSLLAPTARRQRSTGNKSDG